MQIVHDCGALLFFLCGILYIVLQCFISYYEYPVVCSKHVFRVRVSLAMLAVVAFIPSILSDLLECFTECVQFSFVVLLLLLQIAFIVT